MPVSGPKPPLRTAPTARQRDREILEKRFRAVVACAKIYAHANPDDDKAFSGAIDALNDAVNALEEAGG